MEKGKAIQAVILGSIGWLFGLAAFALFHGSPLFPGTTAPAVLAGAPLPLWVVAYFYLKSVPAEAAARTAAFMSLIVLVIQFVLDGAFMFAVFHLGFPRLSNEAVRASFLALEIGYFYIGVIPWLEGVRQSKAA